MEFPPSHRLWMYDRLFPKRAGLKQSFVDGVWEFILFAMTQEQFRVEGGIRCPCVKCECGKIRNPTEVIDHLKRVGFRPNYWIWTSNGEKGFDVVPLVGENCRGASSNSADIGCGEQINLMQNMVCDGLGVNVSFEEQQYDNMEELPNEQAQRFYNLLLDANKPLFEGSSNSKLSICAKLLALKSLSNTSEVGMDLICDMMSGVTPLNENLPKNFYEAKRLVSKLGLEARRIDCCPEGHMLYYDNEFGKKDVALLECKFCNAPRYHARKIGTSSKNKPIPVKSMFYLPITPRLQRMFASEHIAGKMTLHFENKCPGVLRHPSDGEAWKHFDRVQHEFAADPRNVRLGLCSDGFTPYTQASASPYSCWPVIVTPYNLPPEMCMTKPYMFLTCLIPGPENPKAGIDIYLEPLIDDLKRLWNGVSTYDYARKENFLMRAALMWTINDFPAYGMLSGWQTHGKLACPHCMEHTKAFTLKHGGKSSWFDSHRRFLPHDNAFRRNKNAFKNKEVENDEPPPRLTPDQVWDRVRDLPKITDDPLVSRFHGYGQTHNWTKRSIFWDLPYWKDNLLRHNLDVMHIEKNFFDRKPHVEELHRHTHIRKGTGEFVEDRARITQEEFQRLLSQSDIPVDPVELAKLKRLLWEKAAGGPYKSRVYGTGGIVDDDSGASTSASLSPEARRIIQEMSQQFARQQEQLARQQRLLDYVFQHSGIPVPPPDWQPLEQDQPAQQGENEDADDGDGGDHGDRPYGEGY